MAQIVNLVSFLILVLSWPNALSIDTEAVKDMADEFSALTSSTWDIVNQLKFVSENAVKFVRVAGPVGAIIATAIDIGFSPESDEQKAIKELHKFVETKFEDLKRHVEHEANSITNYLVKVDYQNMVTRPLNIIDDAYKGITDQRKEERSHYKEEFITKCKGINTAPSDVLINMKYNLVEQCHLPSQEQAESYAAVLELFQRIEQRHHHLLNQNDAISVEKYEKIKSSILAKSAKEALQGKLNTILNSANTADEVWQALNKLDTDFHHPKNTCWIQTIADSNKWKREPLVHFAKIVWLDLIRASLIASHCANVIYAGKQKDIDITHRKIKSRLQEITAHVADWIAKMLEITWPTISRTRAKSAIGDSDIAESEKEYQNKAEKIKDEVDQYGAEEYDYAVIVLPNWTNPEAMAIICEANSCFELIDVKKVNVIVVRIEDNKTNYELACKAAAWFTPQIKAKMIHSIRVWWDRKTDLDRKTDIKLIDLAKELKQMLQFYRHLVLIHNWKFFSSAATITLGVAKTYIKSVMTEQGFNHKIEPVSFIDAEIFHVHMLL
ncbi:hypothetical protein niasHT_036367 [Heterodera trifolii]|uniref:Uncharacterized protein n=1 Tax=Heterodera trifolii TaxID=157864 RepID=A0ABD2J1V0_9BILA